MITKPFKPVLISLFIFSYLLAFTLTDGFGGTPPKSGDTLPNISFKKPETKAETVYLGIGDALSFTINDINAQLIVLEIIGVYCPVCQKQRPHINRLFHRINKNPDLKEKIKFLGIATGATAMESAFYTKQFKVPYPVLADETFDFHKRIGEPRTPYNIVVNREGKVLYAHLGLIEDMNRFFETLKNMSETQ